MVEQVRAFLKNQAHQLAMQAFEAMSDPKRLTLLMVEDRSVSIHIMHQAILDIADTLVSGNPAFLLESAKHYATMRAQSGIPVQYGLERLRLIRENLLNACHIFTQQHAKTVEDRLEVSHIELRIYRYLDMYLECYTLAYIEEQAAARSEQSHAQVGKSFRDVEAAEKEIAEVVFHSNDIGLLLIDRDLIIRDVNNAFVEMLQLERGNLLNQNIDQVLSHLSEIRFFRLAVEQGTSGHYVIEYQGKWVTFTIRPVQWDQERWGAIAVFRSVTQSKQFEEELSKRDALAAVGQLAAGIAHEIRNPLTSVKGFIQLLREQLHNEQTAMYFTVIYGEIERIEGLINDVLVLARFRDDKLLPEHFELNEEIEGVVRLLEPEANRRGISLVCNKMTTSSWIFGQRPRIKQVFLNLCKNAIEALAEKGTTVQITIFSSGGQVMATVEDDGPGLTEQVLQHMFVPFFTTKQEGTGLGLLMTKRIVEDHRGRIVPDNSPTLTGARFTISFPASKGPM